MAEGRAAVHCDELQYTYGSVRALSGVSFDVRPGELFGLLGPNGAGKTTTIRMLTTLLPVQGGAASVFGVDVSAHPMSVRRLIGYVPQQLSAEANLTGYENVWLFARLFDLPRHQLKQRVSEALRMMDLEEPAKRLVSTFSGGMIRRLELAQALVNRPQLLILDEPTIGLDPVARESVWDRVRTLREETGMTVLLTTHYMEEADQLCDRVALMHKGQVAVLGTPEELKRSLGPEASLDDVFRHYSGSQLDEDEGNIRDVRSARRVARRMG
ncbi:MAG: ATP-binding cassette domain-containing protein [Candidatus Dormibacteraeota bacterium]|nr:ATP-binding cassette domain-containing protein [Candidatus Dormibacteraeota bacterium]